MKPNFSGYATKYGVLCTDGRVIVADAFAHQDTVQLPLLWRHDDKSPENVLGHVLVKHEAGVGVKIDAFFNQTSRGVHSKGMVEHGDISSLSIKAVRLQQDGANVTGGDMTEVSLVPVGANKGARIESVYLQHEDGDVVESPNAGIIFSGEPLMHEDDSAEHEDGEEESSDENVQDVYNSMTDKQKLVVDILIDAAAGGVEQEDSEGESDNLNHEGENMSGTKNVFDQSGDSGSTNTLSHEQVETIFAAAKNGNMKLSDAVLAHAAQYGITNIEALFPHAKPVTDTPEWIKRDDSWVAGVLSAVKRSPFSKIKSWSADVTHEDARARGYIKGTMKKDEYYAISGRETTTTTIYKKQKLDRDDEIDVSTFAVAAWMKEEMRWMLQEETARAILFGDNRDPGSPDKVKAINLRPIAFDDDFYTTKILINANLAAKSLAKKILRSRKSLKGGTGKATLYTNDDLIIDLLLMEDQLGRRYYETEQSLAAALGVRNIVDCEVLDETYKDSDNNVLIGVIVNLADYTVGADSGGETTMFEDFDIDFNQKKYLIEHRLSGALTRHKSAIALFTSSAVRTLPEEPELTGVNALTIPDQTGVVYYRAVLGQPNTDISGTVVTLTSANTPFTVQAEAESGYRFPLNVSTDWTFNWQDPEA